MDLLGKVAVIAIVLIILFTVGFIIFQQTAQQTYTAQQAANFVYNYLKTSNPNANVTLINVTNSTLKKNSYVIVFSIVYNGTRPCPTLFISQYDYPATGLVPSINNVYTKNCIIYGLSTAPTYVVSAPQIAIVRSYTLNNTQIRNYVSTNGYNNTSVFATYYPYLNKNVTKLAKSFINVWLIRYKAKNVNYSIYAVLGQNASILGNYTGNP